MSIPRNNWVQGGAILLAGFAIGWVVRTLHTPVVVQTTQASVIRENNPNYKFINPLLLCNLNDQKDLSAYQPLQEKIYTLIAEEKNAHKVSDMSVFFRINGKWGGINENNGFVPASLLKVPIMIAYYKMAETHPELLSKKIIYTGDLTYDSAQTIPPEDRLIPGKEYTIQELMRSMIVDSDNNAAGLLYRDIDLQTMKDIGSDLGVSIPGAEDVTATISAKAYATFLGFYSILPILHVSIPRKRFPCYPKHVLPMG
jgi:hypothetical protein